MKHSIWSLLLILVGAAQAAQPLPANYLDAVELIHQYNGSGDQLERVERITAALQKSAPKSGLAESLLAEQMSTWILDDCGEPAAVKEDVLRVADQALALNPKLALPHVSKSRALLRTGHFDAGAVEIDKALALDPNLIGAFFMKAELFRRTRFYDDAAFWYEKFVASARHLPRKANAYSAMARMYEAAAKLHVDYNTLYLDKAGAAYQRAAELNPNGAYANVDYAIFLNAEAADFDAAERHAQKALSLQFSGRAQRQWATAMYQKIWAKMDTLDGKALAAEVDKVQQISALSPRDLLDSNTLRIVTHNRIGALQYRLSKVPPN